ncbi:hypothetical protein CONCODRAFT_86955 [Conidiobolus coronatus NRRL 28638]|uniref:RNI-like protein n=1 Tax=Conidiobolus coronatus (strain ATCC 28846 / CBS 209.66 / NRRL 28638) TaxID=796925 RepID=A0A137NXP2_CONC2|nr:hypothetical protein CONCODRAFT_86955 [Conidiobolus coronatus NRRL 28638]|eukprot:KXN67434.1 hypothetical protein CONCODRAFT_86955 [Conidiobolus coronatus NRRL 28638]
MLQVVKFNNKNAFRNTKWELIFIFNDFQQYLYFRQLCNISLLNKYLREKLKIKIFNSIKLSHFFLRQFPNYFNNTNENELNDESVDTNNTIITRSSKINLFIDELIKKFDSFLPICKSLEFLGLGIAGYYIIPKVCYFNHLTHLRLFDCLMGLKCFIRLMEKLENLQFLDLYELNFIKFQDDEVTEGDIIIPKPLKGIGLTHMHVFTASCISDPYEVLNNYDSDILEVAHIPPQHLSNLSKLELSSAIDNLNLILDFLSLNPQLSEIIIPISNFSIEIIKMLSESGNVKHLKIDFIGYEIHYPNDVTLPKLSSLSSLKILYISERDYCTILKLLEAFPNLAKLIITLKHYSADFIVSVLRKLNNLKYLKLAVYNLLSDEFNFNVFSNIRVLKVNIVDNMKVLYKLPVQPCKLKSIRIASNPRYLENMNYMLEDDDVVNNWNIKLLGQSIKCRAKKT